MPEHFVAKAADLLDGQRRILTCGGAEIGVLRHDGALYAYSNVCLHQGGPACEGLVIARVEERIMPDSTSRGLYFSETERHFVCPWHGYEYDLKTGECAADRRLALAKYEVVQRGDDIYVIV
jgi:nitrite reductase/ring-hydroxylating ferredoxin subunit